MSLYDSIGNAWAWLAGWPSLRRLNLALFQLGGRGLGFYNHRDRALSGELAFLRDALARESAPVVFDVGANEGDWSAFVLRVNPHSRVFAVEPHPQTYARLVAKLPEVRAFNVGLGERTGTLALHDHAGASGSGHASLVAGVIEALYQREAASLPVRVTTLDELAAAERVDAISLLKIDVEGMELAVLRGARRLIEQGAVRRIQFEFHQANVVSRTFFADFHALLSPRYRLYRLLPHGRIPIDRYYAWTHEQFVFQNIVAELRTGPA